MRAGRMRHIVATTVPKGLHNILRQSYALCQLSMALMKSIWKSLMGIHEFPLIPEGGMPWRATAALFIASRLAAALLA
jgi:hypothetical protein